MNRYNDLLTPELRGDLAVWCAVGVKSEDRTMAGPPPTDDREAAYHRLLTRTVNARYSEALKVWENRIVEYVGKRDEQTIELAKQLDNLQRWASTPSKSSTSPRFASPCPSIARPPLWPTAWRT